MNQDLKKGDNPFSLTGISDRPKILDGATGSLLQQMGYKANLKNWMTYLNSSEPHIIKSIHESYINAGAEIITTNTFRTNPAALSEKCNDDCSHYVETAVRIAKEAIKNLPIYLAGSNAPAEDCYQKNRKLSYNLLEVNHKKHIDLLIKNEVHFILNETQSHFDEIKIICRHCQKNRIPYVVSILFDANLRILSGESLMNVLNFVLEHGPLAIGFNCITPKIFDKFLEKVDLSYNWGFYLNCAGEDYFSSNIECNLDPIEYIKYIDKYIKYKPSFIGACCGSSPEHIEALRKYLYGKIS